MYGRQAQPTSWMTEVASFLPAGPGSREWRRWVALRRSAPKVHRRKAARGIPLPESRQLAVRTPDPSQ